MMTEAERAENAQPTPRLGRKSRRIGLLALGVVGIMGVLLVRHFWFSTPIGNGPAGPAVPRAPFQTTWTTRPVLLVGIGDSITAGFGASAGHSYFDMLMSNPANESQEMQGISLKSVLPNLTGMNLARAGTTSLQHETDQFNRLEVQPPGVLGLVVMTTGGNDLIHDYGRTPPCEGAMYGATLAQAQPWITAFDSRLSAMLDRLNACFPGGCHVFLANIYDPTDGVGDMEHAGLPTWPDGLKILAAYNEIIARQAAARPNVHLINLHDAFLGHGIHCTQPWQRHYRSADPHYWYYTNLEDPNDRGYDAIRRLFLLAMADSVPSTSNR